jgi:hypothetical protein
MPHFLANIEKLIGAEKWTNVYYLQADDLTDAITAADQIIGIERNVLKSTVTVSHLLVSEREQPFRNYFSGARNLAGTVTPTSGELPLPLWNTVRCEFQPSNHGKPDVKQLRLPLYTDEIATIQTLNSTFRTGIQTSYVNQLVSLGFIEDDAGNAWVSGLARPEIFDRQLKKRRRKKVTI